MIPTLFSNSSKQCPHSQSSPVRGGDPRDAHTTAIHLHPKHTLAQTWGDGSNCPHIQDAGSLATAGQN